MLMTLRTTIMVRPYTTQTKTHNKTRNKDQKPYIVSKILLYVTIRINTFTRKKIERIRKYKLPLCKITTGIYSDILAKSWLATAASMDDIDDRCYDDGWICLT